MTENIDQEYIDEMKKLAIMSRRLSSFHIKNLQLFGMVALDNVEDLKIEYQLPIDVKEEGFVEFRAKLKKGKAAGTKKVPVKRRTEDLAKWTRHLLWNEMVIKVLINDKEVHLSGRKSTSDNSANSGAERT